jgi:hypothetical protein
MFWKHVDYLIPDEDKVENAISEEEAEERSKTSISALSRIQMQQVNKQN